MSTADSPPFGAAEQASELSADHVVRRCLIEREVGYDLLQLAVLLLQQAQPPHLRRHQAGVLPGSIVKIFFADLRPALDLSNHCAPVNFDRSMAISRPTDRITRAAKLGFSSSRRFREPEAGRYVWPALSRPARTSDKWVFPR
jgi:hypothetical protein